MKFLLKIPYCDLFKNNETKIPTDQPISLESYRFSKRLWGGAYDVRRTYRYVRSFVRSYVT
eukprot:UN16407